jgi:glutaredoxin
MILYDLPTCSDCNKARKALTEAQMADRMAVTAA